MLIRNVKLLDNENIVSIRIENKIITEINPDLSPYENEEIVEGNNLLAISPFIEPHIHLDTTLTAGEPKWNKSGTLFEGIKTWSERKEFLTKQDVKSRAMKVIKWQIANGIQFIRSHVDVTDKNLIALEAMLELREDLKNFVELQIVAFPQEGILSFKNGKELLEQSVKLGADVIGAIPHFEFTREYGVESINFIFDLATKYNKLIDVHCDEIDDEQSRFLEVVATRALESGLKNKVTASHTTAMGSYNNAYTYKLFRLLQLSKINFVCNPLINTHLQGRFDTYPKRRGLTRVKELNENNINVCFGHDDILDPWYPMGTGNMLEVLHFGLHVCQMMGYDDINESIKFITKNSALTLNIDDDYKIEISKPGNLIILDSENIFDAVRKKSDVVYSIREGKIISKNIPKKSYVNLNGFEEINFMK